MQLWSKVSPAITVYNQNPFLSAMGRGYSQLCLLLLWHGIRSDCPPQPLPLLYYSADSCCHANHFDQGLSAIIISPWLDCCSSPTVPWSVHSCTRGVGSTGSHARASPMWRGCMPSRNRICQWLPALCGGLLAPCRVLVGLH